MMMMSTAISTQKRPVSNGGDPRQKMELMQAMNDERRSSSLDRIAKSSKQYSHLLACFRICQVTHEVTVPVEQHSLHLSSIQCPSGEFSRPSFLLCQTESLAGAECRPNWLHRRLPRLTRICSSSEDFRLRIIGNQFSGTHLSDRNIKSSLEFSYYQPVLTREKVAAALPPHYAHQSPRRHAKPKEKRKHSKKTGSSTLPNDHKQGQPKYFTAKSDKPNFSNVHLNYTSVSIPGCLV